MGKARGPLRASGVHWSGWRPLAGWSPEPAVLAETLDGGQAFRWHRDAAGRWSGVWAENAAQLRQSPSGAVEWRAPATIEPRVRAALPEYLGAGRDWPALADLLPWRSDAHLAACLREFRGLRLLKQPFGETLLGFLCSATKQIPQIKRMLALLAERHGAALTLPGAGRAPLRAVPSAAATGADTPVHRLPTWAELAALPEPDLRSCQLGFRARHIGATARFLAAHPGWLAATEAAPYPEAKARLMSLPGVGEKIADCVLLFGAGRLEAFPVDTWILKALARRYGLAGWKPAQVAQFGRAHFGPLAGYAQQFLFAWERRHGGR